MRQTAGVSLGSWFFVRPKNQGPSPTLPLAALPLAASTVGVLTRVHPSVRLALRVIGATDARDLAAVMAAVGLASNLAALVALVTDGIQKGHMALHARAAAAALEASK